MASPVRLSTKFHFGAFTLDASAGELRKSGISIKLRLQAVEVLLMLVERAGQAVTERRPVPHPEGNHRKVWLLAAASTFAVLLLGFLAQAWLSRPREPNLQDFRIVKLTNSGAVTGVAISPDGRYAAYAKLEGDKQGLWLRQIAAQNDVQILPTGTGFHGLTFSPDGNFIYL